MARAGSEQDAMIAAEAAGTKAAAEEITFSRNTSRGNDRAAWPMINIDPIDCLIGGLLSRNNRVAPAAADQSTIMPMLSRFRDARINNQ
jgi:hypothetical protein